MRLDPTAMRRVIDAALDEDLADRGDLTTDAVIPEDRRAVARLVARSPLVLSGLPLAREVFRLLDAELDFRELRTEGQHVEAGRTLATVEGRARSILRGERVALNFLARMCGIATATREAVTEIASSGARILDTRKTAPGLRQLDKYAVFCGGGTNHRMGLYDAVMIKDTHLGCGGSVEQAVRLALDRGHPAEQITAEVRDRDQLAQAIRAGAGRALLDNMDLGQMREAVEFAAGRIVLEASGGLRPGRLLPVAETGVDYLSLGWLTHSAPAADLAMEIESRP